MMKSPNVESILQVGTLHCGCGRLFVNLLRQSYQASTRAEVKCGLEL